MLVLPVLAATRRVLSKMLGSESTVGNPTALRQWERIDFTNVVIPVEGHYRGAFVISVSSETALSIARELRSTSDAELNASEAESAVRECVRMMLRITGSDDRMKKVQTKPPLNNGNEESATLIQNLRPWIAIPLKTRFGEVVVGASVRLVNSLTESKPNAQTAAAAVA